MTAPRFGWLGVTRRQAIVGRLDQVLETWSGEWSMQADGGRARAQIATEWPHEATLSTAKGIRSAAGQSICHVRGLRHGALGRWLMDIQDEDGVGLAESLAAEALADLSRRIHAEAMGAAPADLREVDNAGSPDVFRAWTGALHAQVRLGRIDIDLLLDRELCASMATPSPTPRHVLATRAGALADVTLRLDATLDFGGASLADLSNLQVGELLVSDVPLTAHANLVSDAGKPLASGRLSRAGARLALSLQTTQE